jgi:hypothetical protein
MSLWRYCMSYSQQAFGQIKTDNPVKHGVIKGIRDDFSKYVSNRMSDLKRAVRKELNKGIVRESVFKRKNGKSMRKILSTQ